MKEGTANSAAVESFRENIPLLQALGDTVSQDIIIILCEHQTLNVNEITELMNVSRPAISHHLKILKNANVVRIRKEGKYNVYYLEAKNALEKLKDLITIVEANCDN